MDGFDVAPDVPEVPEVPEIPETPEIPATVDVLESPDTPEPADVPVTIATGYTLTDEQAAPLEGFPPPDTWQTGKGDEIAQAQWSAGISAAEAQHDAALAVQQADSLGEAIAATLQANNAGDAELAMGDRMAEYISSQQGITLEVGAESYIVPDSHSDSE